MADVYFVFIVPSTPIRKTKEIRLPRPHCFSQFLGTFFAELSLAEMQISVKFYLCTALVLVSSVPVQRPAFKSITFCLSGVASTSFFGSRER